jgi:hypothetical protein
VEFIGRDFPLAFIALIDCRENNLVQNDPQIAQVCEVLANGGLSLKSIAPSEDPPPEKASVEVHNIGAPDLTWDM